MKVIIKSYRLISFILYYVVKLVQSNIYIAYNIITPGTRTNPDYLWVPIRINSKFGLLLFSNLLSMTPGTLSIDFSEVKNELLVHYLYSTGKNTVIKEIETLQNKIIELIK